MINSKNNFFETSDGTILYYEDYGKGDPILLVHGFCCSSQVFKRNIEGLTLKYGYNKKHYKVDNECGAEYRLFVTARAQNSYQI